MPQKISWHNESRRVKDLIPNPKNPRQISETQNEALKKSLLMFNLSEVPVINLDNQIIVGHQRLKILGVLGRSNEEIDVRVPNRKLSQRECEQYLLTSNAVHGSWDYDLLKDFDLDLLLDIGFDDFDLSQIFDDQIEVEDDVWDTEKELAKIKTTDIKPGNFFQMGSNRLGCIDSTKLESVKKLVGGKTIQLINTDIPYNIGLDYNSGIGGKKAYGGKANDNKTDVEYSDFVKKLIQNGLAVAQQNCHVFFWCDEKYVGMLQDLYKQLGVSQKRLCLWLKDNQNPTPQVAFNKTNECCLYGARGKPYLCDRIKNLNEVMNKEVGTGSRLLDDILDLLNIWLVKRLAGNEYSHPTEKPPSLYEKSLRRCSKPGDIILDLCTGSGAILSATHQLKRTAYLAEIEPLFCQLILNRYEKLTGQKPKKLN